MKRALLLTLLCSLLPATALARPWNNITPGQSTRQDVVHKFGEPTKKVKQGDKEILAYVGDSSIKGTTQAQFTVLPDGKVEQITVFPAVTLDISEIEDTYGKACSVVEKAGQNTPNCYHKQLTDDFRTYFWFKRLGVVVFFGEDKKTVYSMSFVAPASPGASARNE